MMMGITRKERSTAGVVNTEINWSDRMFAMAGGLLSSDPSDG